MHCLGQRPRQTGMNQNALNKLMTGDTVLLHTPERNKTVSWSILLHVPSRKNLDQKLGMRYIKSSLWTG